MGDRWYCVKLWFRELPEKVAWKAAWLLPRKVALLAFVRVCSASGDAPGNITYESAYRAWESGRGR